MARLTLSAIVALWATILYLHSHVSPVCARLTEFQTERLPILAHNLHTTNIDLKTLSQRAKLGPRGGFRFKNGDFHKTRKGGKRVRLVQTYAGYEVYGPTIVAELDLSGYFTGQMYGEVARDLHKEIPNPKACVRDVKTLLNRAIRLENLYHADKESIDERGGRRVILADLEKRKAIIAYVVEFFYSGREKGIPVYYIDACSNAILFHFDRAEKTIIPHHHHNSSLVDNRTQPKNVSSISFLKFKSEKGDMNVSTTCAPSAVGVGGNPNTGEIVYNKYPNCLPVTESSGTCTMESNYAIVIDNGNTISREKSTVVTFPCRSGFSDPSNGAFGVANDALYFFSSCGDFFQDQYGIKALKHKQNIVVHYGQYFANAFTSNNVMYFGDGDDRYYPFVSLDIVAHELAQTFTKSNSGLMYCFQMGGINEAFSDITSVAARKYILGMTDWTFGSDAFKSGNGAFRYLNDPPKDGKSIKNIWKYNPLMNVHYSSGIFNYAFYNLIESERVSMIDGYEDFLVANVNLWGTFTRFRKGACNVMQASYDNGHKYNKILKAFKHTGIGLHSCAFDALKTTLFPGETRTKILVKSERSPILEIDMSKWKGIGAKVEAEDMSIVRIVAASDRHVEKIIAEGDNYIEFPGNHPVVYVQLMSNHKEDVEVTLKVIQGKQE